MGEAAIDSESTLSKACYRNETGASKVAALSLLGFFIAQLLLLSRTRVGERLECVFGQSKIDHHCQLCRRWSQHSCHIPEGGEEGGDRESASVPSTSGSQRLLFSLSLPPTIGALVCRRACYSRLGNPGGILFNIYIYIYMSNGDRPSASLVKGRAG